MKISRKQSKVDDLPPCPNCGAPVEWTNSRDGHILKSYIACTNMDRPTGYNEPCDGVYFAVETISFVPVLPNLDYETSVMKYKAWVASKPNGYRRDGVWD